MQHKHIWIALCVVLCVQNCIAIQRLVSTTGSDVSPCSSPCATLQFALSVATSGDVITLSAGTYVGVKFRELIVPDGVTIKGAGIDSTIIDLGNLGRAFLFNGVTANVESLTLARGRATTFGEANMAGGCVTMVDGTVTFTDVKFDSCIASGNTLNAPGGAIYSSGTLSTLTRVQFLNCRAGVAGALYVTGTSDMTILDSVFEGCMTYEGGWGGAIVPEDKATMLIERTTFRNGYSNFGGAIDDGGSATYTVRDSIFQNNSALYGGGVYTFGFSIPTYENCSFIGNVANNAGGGVRTTSSSLGIFKGCTFIKNSAGSGGGISSFSLNETVVDECYFYDNYAQQQGGGMACQGPTTIMNSIVDSCRSDFISAGIDLTGSLPFSVTNTTFRNNKSFRGAALSVETGETSTFLVQGCTFTNNSASSAGAVVTAGLSILDMRDVVLTGNNAINGGAIQTTSGSKLLLTNAKLIQNTASYGGAIYFGDASSATLSNVEFDSNSAIFYGGAVYHDAVSQPTITNARFYNNTARSGGAYAISEFVSYCINVSSSDFVDNRATIGGGGIFFQVTDSAICDFSLGLALCPACSFSGNTALFGTEIATSASRLQFSEQPPSTLASSELFSLEIQVVDRFAQIVKQSRDLLVQVSVSEGSVLKGVVEQEVTDDGIAQFKLLKILASPQAEVTVHFTAIPAGTQSANFTIIVSDCADGTEAYLVGTEFHCLKVFDVKQPLRVSIYILASVLIVLSVALLAVLVVKRNHSVIRKASPVLCWVIVIGAILCYISTYFWLQTGDGFCVLRVWLLCLGFAMMYGSFFAKEWRLWRLFTVASVKPMTIRDSTLLKAVAVLVSVEALVLLFWFIFFPYLERVVIDLNSVTESITYECYSTTPGFLYALYALNCALLLFGCFLAIKTRRLPQNYNESKHLAFSIYNATLTLFVIVPVTSAALTDPDAIAIAVTAGILFETTMSLLILFGPKMYLTLNEGVILQTLKKEAEKLQNDLLWKRKQIAEFEKNGTIEIDIGSTSTPPTEVRGQSLRSMGPMTTSSVVVSDTDSKN